jgi:hypothetical protein
MVSPRWFEVHAGNATPWEAEVMYVVEHLLRVLEAVGKDIDPKDYGYYLAGADAWAKGRPGRSHWTALTMMLKRWEQAIVDDQLDTGVPGDYFTHAFTEIEAVAQRLMLKR